MGGCHSDSWVQIAFPTPATHLRPGQVCLPLPPVAVQGIPLWNLPLSEGVYKMREGCSGSFRGQWGLLVLLYLGDWLVCASSKAEVSRNTSRLIAHVTKLGLRVNHEKSKLTPSQVTTFLGLSLNTVTMEVHPSVVRVDDTLHMLSRFRLGVLPFATFLQLLGTLTSVTRVVPLGLFSLRPFQRWLNSFHLDSRGHKTHNINNIFCLTYRANMFWYGQTIFRQYLTLIIGWHQVCTASASVTNC